MRRIILAAVGALFSVLAAGEIAVAGGGHVGVGGDGYMISSLPSDRGLYKMYNIYYYSDKLKDNSGHTAAGDDKVESFTQMHRFLFQTGHKIFGADWMINVAVPLSWTDMSSGLTGRGHGMDRFGLGDVPVSPMLLGWHGDRWDALFDVLIFAPIGDYSADDPSSPGKGYWSIIPAVGLTYYFDEEKTFNISTMARYEMNTKQRHTDYRHGDNIHWEASIGKTFNGVLDLALTGGASWQVTDSKGFGDQNGHHLRKHVIGPEIGLNAWGMNFNLRQLFEFKNKNTTEGSMTVFSIVKMF
ncbi:MAG: transporter [Candidatus Adiutrix sp.]|jgi:hypothetical protein|nr:transporter [Candidatus Adiutrix sp.]